MLGFTLFAGNLIHRALGQRQTGLAVVAGAHVLKPTPKTVIWGYFDGAAKPVLKIKSGDAVEVQTLLAGSPERLQSAFLPADEVEPALRDIFSEVKDKGAGGHILT